MNDSSQGISIETTVDGAETPEVLLTVSGDFDSTQTDAFEIEAGQVPEDARAVVVDISACKILDSASLGSLVRLKLRVEQAGGAFSIVADKPFQLQILESTGLGDYLGLRNPD